MAISLGIDTGGTYTDVVVLDDKCGVVGKAKTLTTKHDLAVGIQNTVEAALPDPPPNIQLVSLSSTLATNAIVEGKRSPICLLLIGYDLDMMDMTNFTTDLKRVIDKKTVVFIQGGHTVTGEEQAPLDISAVRRAILTYAPHVASFAISGFFGVRNPTHELRVKRLVRRLTELPVTCGHELTTHLHAPRRALTVAMNAQLIPLMQQLILGVSKTLNSLGIRAPLMIVKGDGSLMDAKMALERPIETILSGPAASVAGTRHLSNVEDGFVVDIGGTTTDIAVIHNGHPVLNPEGAWVGDRQTMVEAVDVRTTGLGGDSEVCLDEASKLYVGPRRVVPLCLLAKQYPAVLDALCSQLKRYEDGSTINTDVGHFVLRQRPLRIGQSSSSTKQEIWRLLNDSDGLISLSQLLDGVKYPFRHRHCLDELMEQDIVVASAFTPTDAVHVLGQYRCGSVEAAKLGATLWARRLDISKQEFCERVVRQVVVQTEHAVIASALAEEGGLTLKSSDIVGRLLINRALSINNGGVLSATISLRYPIVGIGAPVTTYLPPVAEQLNTSLCIPEHAEVANAIGAVASGVVQTVCILIKPVDAGSAYRVHLPFGVRDFPQLADAVTYTKRVARRVARHRAYQAGASVVKVCCEQHDRTVMISGNQCYIEIEVIATAVGRPQLKDKATVIAPHPI
ncbi:hydantoinase/oxoprolinase N-terminal domain-containing protein [Chloroflexota bacterium]